jgi:hypothetical protein
LPKAVWINKPDDSNYNENTQKTDINLYTKL